MYFLTDLRNGASISTVKATEEKLLSGNYNLVVFSSNAKGARATACGHLYTRADRHPTQLSRMTQSVLDALDAHAAAQPDALALDDVSYARAARCVAARRREAARRGTPAR